jgi:DNA-binding NarL/FixJ family response regulator
MSAFPSAPIILLSEGEGADKDLAALKRGARGYIPTSATLDIAIGATQVVWAGGTFVPASSLSELAHLVGTDSEMVAGHFTPRQMAVLAPLRQGNQMAQLPANSTSARALSRLMSAT